MRIKSLVGLCLLSWSIPSYALTVDKMVLIPGKEAVSSEIKVTNPDSFPVFFKVTLSELKDNGDVVALDVNDFESWPIYVERDSYILEQDDEVVVRIQHLAKQIGNKNDKDRILAIDIAPESVAGSSTTDESVSILLGYRVWMILSKDGEVKGTTSVVKTDNGYMLKNNTNTVALFRINACDSEFKEGIDCKGQQFVLSGKEKPITFSEFKNGIATVLASDAYDRYKTTHSVKL